MTTDQSESHMRRLDEREAASSARIAELEAENAELRQEVAKLKLTRMLRPGKRA